MLFAKGTNTVISVEGMHCVKCAAKVENALKALDGVKKAKVDLDKKSVSVVYDSAKVAVDAMKAAINAVGFKA